MGTIKSLLIGLLFTASFFSHAKTVEHTLGTITLNGTPQRVVVLSHGALDFLDQIGVEPVGVIKQLIPEYLQSKYSDSAYRSLGSLKEPNFEEIYMAKPDLIIAEGRQAQLYQQLSEIAPTYMFQVDTKPTGNRPSITGECLPNYLVNLSKLKI